MNAPAPINSNASKTPVLLPFPGHALSVDGDIAMEPALTLTNAWWALIGPSPRSSRLLVRWEERYAAVDALGVVAGTPPALELLQLTVRAAVEVSGHAVEEPHQGWPAMGTFQVLVDHRIRKVRFGPVGNLGMVYPWLASRGIGSYALSYLVRWLQARFPQYQFERPSLSSVDSSDPDNRARRDRLYHQIGLLGHGFALVQDLRPDLRRLEDAAPDRMRVKGYANYVHALSREHRKCKRLTVSWHEEMDHRRSTERKLTSLRRMVALTVFVVATLLFVLISNGLLVVQWRSWW